MQLKHLVELLPLDPMRVKLVNQHRRIRLLLMNKISGLGIFRTFNWSSTVRVDFMNYLLVDIYILEGGGERKEVHLVRSPVLIICLIIIAVDDARLQLERRFRLIDVVCTLGLNKTISYTGYIIIPYLDPSTQPRREMSLDVSRLSEFDRTAVPRFEGILWPWCTKKFDNNEFF